MRPESRGEMNQEATEADRNHFSYFLKEGKRYADKNNVMQFILWFMD